MARDLGGKVIVITGASSGIGAATALACAKAGMNVVLNARRAEKLDAVAGLARQVGAEAVTVVGDVTEPDISGRMLEAARDRFDRFDAVFANAGYGFDLAAHEVSDEALRKIFDVNFFAAMDLLNAAASRLLAEGRPGHLLMCSSCLGKFTLPGHSAYSATKAAQAHVCTAMRIELQPRGIYVSSVHPITTVTEFFEVSAQLSGRDAAGKSVPEHAPRFFVQPAERVADAVVRCLRRPRPEVWTSFMTRAVAALMTLSPRLGDVILRQAWKHDQQS
ncbi:MAG: SDR family NAD(P)-dependent oxidoreductase [Planctomycetota bacterium]|jgi:short-subunit dehydrogenase